MIYWACDKCDSGVLIPKQFNQSEVNVFMEKKLPCLPPIDRPLDDIIDNRTTIVNKPKIIIP